MTRTRTVLAAGAALLLLLAAGCGMRRDPAGSHFVKQACVGTSAAHAKDRVAQVWRDAGKRLGLKTLRPPPMAVCQVDTRKYAKKPPYTIAYASQGPTNSWATEADYFFRHEAGRRGADVLYASANGDAGTQVGNIQDLLAQHPDALVVQPMGSAVKGQVQQAAAQGVPVVVCTGRLPADTGGVVSTVGRSYELQGTLTAEWLAKTIGYAGDIAYLSGIPGVPTSEYQYAAAKKVFAKYPKIHAVTRQYTQWSPTQAKKVAASLAVRYPHLNGVWTDSGVSETGVIQAYQAAGKKIPPMTGDSSNAFLRSAAAAGGVRFAQTAYPPEQTATCADTAVDILRGRPVPSVQEVDSAVYTDAELNRYYRRDCTDNLWVPTSLTRAQAKELKLC